MKTFVAAILIFTALIAATAVNAYFTRGAVETIEAAVKRVGNTATEDNARAISNSLRRLEENRAVLHLSLRHTHIDQLAQLLFEAHAYCLAGDTPSMNATVSAALFKLDRWKQIESFTLYNVL